MLSTVRTNAKTLFNVTEKKLLRWGSNREPSAWAPVSNVSLEE